MLLHFYSHFHKSKYHFDLFHAKHNISALTIGLLVAFAIQMNILLYLGMLPAQTIPLEDVNLSLTGTTISTALEVVKNIIF